MVKVKKPKVKPTYIRLSRNTKHFKKAKELDDLQYTDPERHRELTVGNEDEMLEDMLETYERQKKQREELASRMQENSGTNFDINDDDFDSGWQEAEAESISKTERKAMRFDEIWESNSELIKSWFLESFSFGKADPCMKEPRALAPVECSCNKVTAEVMVYMMHNSCVVKVDHCKCRSLVKALILMHVFPSSAKSPKNGCHFALLDYLHLAKMNAKVSNHGFTNIVNQHLLILKSYDLEFKKLSEIVLNNCYQAYRKSLIM